ncbi:Uncharacterized mitochondrial protein AtMg00310 [Linum grandiflorum]
MEPETLAERVYKAKYYADGDFLSASLGSSPSYTWRSVCHSQIVIAHGVRWRVGDGQTISFWHDTWLRRDGRFEIESIPLGNTDIRLAGLIQTEGSTKTWDIRWPEGLVNDEELDDILSIPRRENNVDTRIWHYSNKGVYTVKSGYKLLMEGITTSDHLHFSGQWNKLWSSQVAPKIRHLVWRGIRDVLSTWVALSRKGGCCSTRMSDLQRQPRIDVASFYGLQFFHRLLDVGRSRGHCSASRRY